MLQFITGFDSESEHLPRTSREQHGLRKAWVSGESCPIKSNGEDDQTLTGKTDQVVGMQACTQYGMGKCFFLM